MNKGLVYIDILWIVDVLPCDRSHQSQTWLHRLWRHQVKGENQKQDPGWIRRNVCRLSKSLVHYFKQIMAISFGIWNKVTKLMDTLTLHLVLSKVISLSISIRSRTQTYNPFMCIRRSKSQQHRPSSLTPELRLGWVVVLWRRLCSGEGCLVRTCYPVQEEMTFKTRGECGNTTWSLCCLVGVGGSSCVQFFS